MGDSPGEARTEEPFGANEMRLSGRQWLAFSGILLVVVLLTPAIWARVERFDTGPDYRIPYELSQDYWLYGRWLGRAAAPERVVVLGDSVVWGEYVLPDGTLSHFLGQESGAPGRFANVGVNGFFPLAMEGLIRHYGGALRGRKVLLHCNPLWLTTPEADLSADREQEINHSRLLPQFRPRIPAYQASTDDRLSAVVGRSVPFIGWVRHLQNAYFAQKSLAEWTLADDGGDPQRYPNAWKNPLARITFAVPPAAPQTEERGPSSPRHRPWSESGAEPSAFDWVPLDASLQWGAFRRLALLLKERGDDLFVVVGPFNEHMMAAESRPAYLKMRAGIEGWLESSGIPHAAPDALPSDLYADASHPLTPGYDVLARNLLAAPAFAGWLDGRASAEGDSRGTREMHTTGKPVLVRLALHR